MHTKDLRTEIIFARFIMRNLSPAHGRTITLFVRIYFKSDLTHSEGLQFTLKGTRYIADAVLQCV
jgi:hypothetical protein